MKRQILIVILIITGVIGAKSLWAKEPQPCGSEAKIPGDIIIKYNNTVSPYTVLTTNRYRELEDTTYTTNGSRVAVQSKSTARIQNYLQNLQLKATQAKPLINPFKNSNTAVKATGLESDVTHPIQFIKVASRLKRQNLQTQTVQLIKQLNQDPSVESVEQNARAVCGATFQSPPNDPAWGFQWGMMNTGFFAPAMIDFDIDAEQAYNYMAPFWNIYPDNEIAVVIGEPVDDRLGSANPDLVDVVSEGYNVLTQTGDYYSGAVTGHEVKVTGIIAAAINNSIGIAGISKGRVAVGVMTYDSSVGATTANVIAALDWASQRPSKIINFSYISRVDSPSLRSAFELAGSRGVLVVAAAGNDSADLNPGSGFVTYPTNWGLPNVISAAATNKEGNIADLSNWGDMIVDVGAPGEGIMTTLPGADWQIVFGTSFAAPHVAGIAALLRQLRPSITYIQIKNLIVSYGKPIAVGPLGEAVRSGIQPSATRTIDALLGQLPCGNVDGQGSVTILDALNIAKFAVGVLGPEAVDQVAADVNRSRTVDILDALAVARYASGLPGLLTCPETM